jgi:hypothetical protein
LKNLTNIIVTNRTENGFSRPEVAVGLRKQKGPALSIPIHLARAFEEKDPNSNCENLCEQPQIQTHTNGAALGKRGKKSPAQSVLDFTQDWMVEVDKKRLY